MTDQPPLWFDGDSYEPDHDEERLGRQLRAVKRTMADQHWRTLHEIAVAIGGAPEASVSARLRDLRKRRFGGYVLERRARGDRNRGLFEYRLLPPAPADAVAVTR